MANLACTAAPARLGMRLACFVLSAFVNWQVACLVVDGRPRVLKYYSCIDSVRHVGKPGFLILDVVVRLTRVGYSGTAGGTRHREC